MNRVRSRLAVVGVVGALLLGGCSLQEPEFTANDQVPAEFREATEAASEGGGEAGGGGLNFVAIDLDFAEAPTEAPAGEATVTLVNDGAQEHNVTFEGLNEEEPVVVAPAGQTQEGSVALEEGQTYTFYCNVAGHEQAMRGELTVGPPAGGGGGTEEPTEGGGTEPTEGGGTEPTEGGGTEPTEAGAET